MVSRRRHKLTGLKGLGVKYGATVRKRYGVIYRTLKKKRRCPKCGSLHFGRIAVGIWQCPKCMHKLAAGAYDVDLEKIRSSR
ncbi:MAG: 50S ribosomal protein L37 [Thermoproteota archaeon]|nr:50S ribosomal protein L37 [Thermoproteota archaeon]